MCVCVCMRACTRACVCVCVSFGAQPAQPVEVKLGVKIPWDKNKYRLWVTHLPLIHTVTLKIISGMNKSLCQG